MSLARAGRSAFRFLYCSRPSMAISFRQQPIAQRMLSTAYPSDRKYRTSHEWVKLEGDVATVGISHHAQKELGDIVFVDLPEIGSSTSASERTATVESVKAAADVYTPVSGEVVEINSELESNPELINSAPHEAGWMWKLKVSDPKEMDQLMDSATYTQQLKESGDEE